jgi:hypothetical protein
MGKSGTWDFMHKHDFAVWETSRLDNGSCSRPYSWLWPFLGQFDDVSFAEPSYKSVPMVRSRQRHHKHSSARNLKALLTNSAQSVPKVWRQNSLTLTHLLRLQVSTCEKAQRHSSGCIERVAFPGKSRLHVIVDVSR